MKATSNDGGGHIEARIKALEARIAHVQQVAKECAEQLLVDDGAGFLVAERLPALGSVALQPLIDIVNDTRRSGDTRVLAALVAFIIGDRTYSVEVLLEEVSSAGGYGPLAARNLARAGVGEVAERITNAWSTIDVMDPDLVVGYLDPLRIAGGTLTDDVWARLSATGSWEIQSALDEWFPRARMGGF